MVPALVAAGCAAVVVSAWAAPSTPNRVNARSDEPSSRRWVLPVLVFCSAIFMLMSPLQAIGQGVWLIPCKPCRHLNLATYPGCVVPWGRMQVCVSAADADTL
ncbi:hypothetical protein D3C76_1410560 [compost metagenome]